MQNKSLKTARVKTNWLTKIPGYLQQSFFLTKIAFRNLTKTVPIMFRLRIESFFFIPDRQRYFNKKR
jgi:hypothetical protein